MKFPLLLAFALCSVSLLSAKSYETTLTLDNTATVGGVELKAGHYSLRLDNSQVRFTDMENGKSVEAAATVVSSEKKFQNTLIDSKQVNGVNQINEIDLGGTKMRVEFR